MSPYGRIYFAVAFAHANEVKIVGSRDVQYKTEESP